MKKLLTLIFTLSTICAYCQNYRLKAGDHFPNLVFRPVVNAPVKELDVNAYPTKKLFILNVWGTWCSPCIPEMDALAKLQNEYAAQIQIVGISNDSPERLRKYLAKKPSKIWLVSDTADVLYHLLDLAFVGQSAILNANRQVVAVVKTDSINSNMIKKLLAGQKVASNAQVKERTDNTGKDAFGVDTLMQNSFTIRSYMYGQQSMGRIPNRGVFAHRRVSFFNIGSTTLYKAAYDIVSLKQIIYTFDKKRYDNYQDKSQLYCFDLLVKPEQKDSLYIIMQQKLRESLPVKARTEMRTMPVYILKARTDTTFNLPESASQKLDYSFSGMGFDGTGVTPGEFAHIYLSNELGLPVVDETGLSKRYNIKTNNDLRDTNNIFAAVSKLGLKLEKAERSVKVVVLYEGTNVNLLP